MNIKIRCSHTDRVPQTPFKHSPYHTSKLHRGNQTYSLTMDSTKPLISADLSNKPAMSARAHPQKYNSDLQQTTQPTKQSIIPRELPCYWHYLLGTTTNATSNILLTPLLALAHTQTTLCTSRHRLTQPPTASPLSATISPRTPVFYQPVLLPISTKHSGRSLCGTTRSTNS